MDGFGEQQGGEARELEVMLKAVLDSSADYILTVNQASMIMYYNRPLPGFKIENNINLSLDDYLPKDQQDKFNEGVSRVFQDEDAGEIPFDMTSDRGQVKNYIASFTPIKDSNSVLAAIISIRDTTNTQQLERENKRFRAQFLDSRQGGTQPKKDGLEQEEIIRLRDELEKRSKECQKLQDQVVKLTKDIDSQKHELEKERKKDGKLQEHSRREQEAISQKQELDKKLKEQRDENTRLQDQVARLSKDIESQKRDFERKKGDVQESQRLKEQVTQLAQESQKLKEQVTQLAQENQGLTEQMGRAKGDAETQRQELEDMVRKKSDEMLSLNQQVEGTTQDNQKLLEQITQLTQENQGLNEQIGRLKGDAETQRQEFEAKINQQSEETKSLNQQVESTTQDNQKLLEQITQLTQENQGLKEQVGHLAEEMDTEKLELDKERKKEKSLKRYLIDVLGQAEKTKADEKEILRRDLETLGHLSDLIQERMEDIKAKAEAEDTKKKMSDEPETE